uniref:Snake toxin/toxin-like domain-containing protein n=1 Tax=Ditylenchus dipsaci TaxID=166011 RepID=A0A915EI99_9BILA
MWLCLLHPFVIAIFFAFYIPKCFALSCYSCQFSFSDVYDTELNQDGWCANATLLKIKPDEVIRPCAAWEIFCITAITTTLTSFTTINRACSESCSTLCESVGYGQNQISCTDCCQQDNCNKNFTVDYYRNVMKKKDTSWTTPLEDEIKYNRKFNKMFPY